MYCRGEGLIINIETDRTKGKNVCSCTKLIYLKKGKTTAQLYQIFWLSQVYNMSLLNIFSQKKHSSCHNENIHKEKQQTALEGNYASLSHIYSLLTISVRITQPWELWWMSIR